MNRAEILSFMRPEEERATLDLLSLFQTATLDAGEVAQASRLYRTWHASHGVDVNDCLLAAQAATQGGIIMTLNTKHFPFADIIVNKAF